MCAVSMVMEHYHERWNPNPLQPAPPVFPTVEEIAEFRKLLARARKYDKENNQPDCELMEKKEKLLKLAEELGVEISFD